MKTLALVGGDLAPGQGGYRTYTGAARIRQDLALALAEPHGTDPYHPEYGSVLHAYVGQPLTDEVELLVRSEVIRVLQQYVGSQNAQMAADALSGSRSRYTYQDVVSSIASVDTHISYDTLKVDVVLRTQSGEMVRVIRTVNL